MKIAAVIAEYNPFHNGHLYQLNQIRKEHDVDRIIVIMSGDFAQRGIPAIVDKHLRTRMALECGADLVLELPVYYALGSAEYFAQGAVALIDKLGVADLLHFGSEAGDISLLTQCASTLAAEPDEYVVALKQYLQQGLSYPAARSHALSAYIQEDSNTLTKALDSPNNILGIEYIKALLQRNSNVQPVTLLRSGSGYNETNITQGQYASANAIRSRLAHDSKIPDNLAEHMPHTVGKLLFNDSKKHFMCANDFSSLLYYKLLEESRIGYAGYYDVTASFSDKLIKNLDAFTSFDDFCLLNKSKDITYNRISRCLMHILLNMKQDILEALRADNYIHYARILGFRKKSSDLLSQIKANASIPLISKLADAYKELEGLALVSLEADVYASQIYEGVKALKYKSPIQNEYTRQIVIV